MVMSLQSRPMPSRYLTLVAACLLLVGGPTTALAQQDNLLFNGDFEQVDDSPSNRTNRELEDLNGRMWDIFDSIPGWETTAGGGIELQHNTLTSAQSGDLYVELDSTGNSAMSQTINLDTGENYELSFYYRARTSSNNDNGIAVYADTSLNSLFSNEIYQVNEARNAGTQWAQHTVSFTANAESMTISFAATGVNNSLGGLVDSISLQNVQLQPGPAPLAGGGAIGLLALLAVFFQRRRFGFLSR